MGGGIFQLIAYGSQDVYLTGNPQITFFKAVYNRHSNFSIESIEQVFTGAPDFNRKVSVTLGRNGDLIHRMFLEAEVSKKHGNPTFVNRPGFALFKSIEIEIGGQIIDKHYGEWMDIWCQLSHSKEQYDKLNHMINGSLHSNKTKQRGKFYIPLQFWFNRNVGLALPIIALQYHDVKINIHLNKEANIRSSHHDNQSKFQLDSLKLYSDYIFLDTDERRRFAQVSHEYLIEQVQFNGNCVSSHLKDETTVKLNFNHPCKELIWTVQSNLSIGKEMGGNGVYHYPFDFSRPNSSSSTLIELEQWEHNGIKYWVERDLLISGNHVIYDNNFNYMEIWGSNITQGALGNEPSPNDPSIVKIFVDKFRDNISDNLIDFSLKFNGTDRFSTREGTYFRLVQSYQHHTGQFDQVRGIWNHQANGNYSKEKGFIYTYSFGINPEEHQPSGTCNFSRIDNSIAILRLNKPNREVNYIESKMKEALLDNDEDTFNSFKNLLPKNHENIIKIYATNYNILRITSGMGGVAYSN